MGTEALFFVAIIVAVCFVFLMMAARMFGSSAISQSEKYYKYMTRWEKAMNAFSKPPSKDN